ncbi:MAG: formimidoylglutamase [Phycisphaerales bacterium JB063]
MPELLPPTVAMPERRAGDVRVGHLLNDEPRDTTRVALIGFPSDAGIQHNGGREGAALGPALIRHHLYRLTPPGNVPDRFAELMRATVDLGDVACTGDVAADQEALGLAIAQLLAIDQRITPIVLGGGHETTLGHFLGYANTDQNVSIVNLDAHTDVRALEDGRPHSGSPFRQAMEHTSQRCTRYTAAGLNPHSTAPAHVEWIKQQGGQAYFRSELTAELMAKLYTQQPDDVLASFDLDALDQSQAPGVSAPNACGLDKRLWLYAAYAAGRSPMVRSMDIVELSPPHDRDDQTARLAALTVWEFLVGFSQRGSAGG